MSKFERGQKVWVRGEIDNSEPTLRGNIQVYFDRRGWGLTSILVDPATIRPAPPEPASEVNAELLAALELSEAYLDPNMRPQDFYALLSAHGWKSNERVLLFIGNFRRAAIAKAKGGQP